MANIFLVNRNISDIETARWSRVITLRVSGLLNNAEYNRQPYLPKQQQQQNYLHTTTYSQARS